MPVVSQVYQEISEVHAVHKIQEQIVPRAPTGLDILRGLLTPPVPQIGEDPWMSLAPRTVEEIPGFTNLSPQEHSFERLVQHTADVSVPNDVPVRPVTQATSEVPQHVKKIAFTVVIHEIGVARDTDDKVL